MGCAEPSLRGTHTVSRTEGSKARVGCAGHNSKKHSPCWIQVVPWTVEQLTKKCVIMILLPVVVVVVVIIIIML